MKKSKLITIEPTKQKNGQGKKYNVAAYARVSTGSDEQKDSLNNQKIYYAEKINSNPDYNFVGIFSDEAISGTTDKRPGFQRMIRLAQLKQIDIIYTKSISRFSRNVVDLLHYCEMLKECGVNLIFEENGIELLNTTGSLLLTILGAVAQMEVENTSEHVSWTLQNKMRKGELVGRSNPLGYDVVDGKLVVNEEEAKIVRYIFDRYLHGAGSDTIALELEKMGAKTKHNNPKWAASTVANILKNEKYTGTLLQGKSFTVSPIGHKRKTNRGEATQYMFENDHEAIISTEDWNKAQEILKSRRMALEGGKSRGTSHNSQQYIFTSKLICGYCGKCYTRRKTHAGTKYEDVSWVCITAVKKRKEGCPKCKPFKDDDIKQAVVGAIQSFIDDTDGMIYLTKDKLNSLLKKSEKKKDGLQEQINQYQKNLDTKMKKKSNLLDMRLEEQISEEEFLSKRANIDKEIAAIQEQLDALTSDISCEDEKNKTSAQIFKLISEGKAEGFNEELFNLLVNKIIVGGIRSDGVDDPKALYIELNPFNFKSDFHTEIKDGNLHFIADPPAEEAAKAVTNGSTEGNSDLCTLNSENGNLYRHHQNAKIPTLTEISARNNELAP